ncbi:hypothetical protein PV328_008641 [Microctonus aethiopoides]|uniref:Uncharacterized protein n=1 Tax=Microctonus aethiopoides TaxID=144406 RepID=A0AA39KRA1_9HYME|nr:hypothetical protein PV328_008641 [Microctonus aethiopoides]
MSSFLSPEFIMVITYLACMLAQIFVLCWYANEVALNSLSIRTAVYNMDWYSLSLKTQKDLRLIIARASSPITFTGGPIVTLSLESFVNASTNIINTPNKKKRLESSLKSTCVKTIDILANNQNLGLDTSGKST